MTLAALQLSLFSSRGTEVAASGPRERSQFTDPFLEFHRDALAAAGASRLSLDEAAWDHSARGAVGVDVESFYNFFVICFKRFVDGTRVAHELSARSPRLDRDTILRTLETNTTISFNGLAYDLPMIYLALSGADTVKLKSVSNRIVQGEVRPWDTEKQIGVRVPRLNHIDLIEPNPSVRQGLKMIHGRLHGRFIVDLPYPHDKMLTQEEMNVATLYCHNDIDATEGMYVALREPLELRAALGKIHGIDLRSKSDSQIGETIVKRQVEKVLGRRVERGVAAEPEFKYVVPEFVKFQDGRLSQLLEKLRETTFFVSSMGKISTPPLLEKLQVRLGAGTYAMGIGGLHSTEAHRALVSDDRRFLLDVDVASQYPSIIMNLGLYPKSMGPAFLKAYGEIMRERLAAKASYAQTGAGTDRVRMDGGRIALNGVYGKLGSPYSTLYSPHLIVAITLTGQLAILMLIERAEAAGIPVVSANTDGVVFYCARSKEPFLDNIVAAWEADTGFIIEKTRYAALYNSSVNTYIAVKEDGKVKRKGAIADPWSDGDLRGQMSKNPQMTILSEAIVRYITNGSPLEETIRECQDPRMFVTLVKVATGAVWRGHPLGRAVRYFWCLDGDPIYYSDGSRKVSKTEGARPLPELARKMPPGIDYARYFLEAERLAVDLGIRTDQG